MSAAKAGVAASTASAAAINNLFFMTPNPFRSSEMNDRAPDDREMRCSTGGHKSTVGKKRRTQTKIS
jgi:hypothetical protein